MNLQEAYKNWQEKEIRVVQMGVQKDQEDMQD